MGPSVITNMCAKVLITLSGGEVCRGRWPGVKAQRVRVGRARWGHGGRGLGGVQRETTGSRATEGEALLMPSLCTEAAKFGPLSPCTTRSRSMGREAQVGLWREEASVKLAGSHKTLGNGGHAVLRY